MTRKIDFEILTGGTAMTVIPELHYHASPGALVNGSRVEKIHSEAGDWHHDGEQGTVVGSLGPAENHYGYFVRWDRAPEGMLIGIMDTRVRPVGEVKFNP